MAETPSAKAGQQEHNSSNPFGPRGRRRAAVTFRAAAALAALSLLSAFAFVGCGDDDDDGDTDAGSTATIVKATERDGTISLDKTSSEGGKVAFQIENSGELTHEFVVFKTELSEDKLPLLTNGTAVDEKGSGVEMVGEHENIAPGSNAELSFDNLAPGKYVIICNVPGHYGLGMHTTFTVD